MKKFLVGFLSALFLASGAIGQTVGFPGPGVKAYSASCANWANVVLQAVNESAADGTTTFVDQSTSAHTLTANGNAQWDTAQAPTGLSSALLVDGDRDFLSTPDSADWNLAGGDYTIELRVRFASTAGVQALISQTDSSGDGGWGILWVGATNMLYYERNGGAQSMNFSWVASANVWYHVAIVSYSSTRYVYIDGTSIGTSANDPANNTAFSLRIGGMGQTGSDFNGHIAATRITKGVAQYTGNFTPPSLPLCTGALGNDFGTKNIAANDSKWRKVA